MTTARTDNILSPFPAGFVPGFGFRKHLNPVFPMFRPFLPHHGIQPIMRRPIIFKRPIINPFHGPRNGVIVVDGGGGGIGGAGAIDIGGGIGGGGIGGIGGIGAGGIGAGGIGGAGGIDVIGGIDGGGGVIDGGVIGGGAGGGGGVVIEGGAVGGGSGGDGGTGGGAVSGGGDVAAGGQNGKHQSHTVQINNVGDDDDETKIYIIISDHAHTRT